MLIYKCIKEKEKWKMKKILEKKLGTYYLIEYNCDNDYYYIQLYKKWSKGGSYEATDYILKFPIKERDRALSIYNGINLKNMYKEMKK